MAEDPRDWEIETQAVRGGLMRTEYGEISEALFLTQSFSYDSAAAAEASSTQRAKGSSPSRPATKAPWNTEPAPVVSMVSTG